MKEKSNPAQARTAYRRRIAAILAVCAVSVSPCAYADAELTGHAAYKDYPAALGTTDAGIIWNYLRNSGYSEAGTAALLGNIQAESGLLAINVQNSFEVLVGSDLEYTYAVDEGIYPLFSTDKVGYGLIQLTLPSRKQAFKDFADDRNASIGNAEIQLAYICQELRNDFPELHRYLLTTSDLAEAVRRVTLQYENPKDHSEAVIMNRLQIAQRYLEQFADAFMHSISVSELEPPPMPVCDPEFLSISVSEPILLEPPPMPGHAENTSEASDFSFSEPVLLDLAELEENLEPPPMPGHAENTSEASDFSFSEPVLLDLAELTESTENLEPPPMPEFSYNEPIALELTESIENLEPPPMPEDTPESPEFSFSEPILLGLV